MTLHLGDHGLGTIEYRKNQSFGCGHIANEQARTTDELLHLLDGSTRAEGTPCAADPQHLAVAPKQDRLEASEVHRGHHFQIADVEKLWCFCAIAMNMCLHNTRPSRRNNQHQPKLGPSPPSYLYVNAVQHTAPVPVRSMYPEIVQFMNPAASTGDSYLLGNGSQFAID